MAHVARRSQTGTRWLSALLPKPVLNPESEEQAELSLGSRWAGIQL